MNDIYFSLWAFKFRFFVRLRRFLHGAEPKTRSQLCSLKIRYRFRQVLGAPAPWLRLRNSFLSSDFTGKPNGHRQF